LTEEQVCDTSFRRVGTIIPGKLKGRMKPFRNTGKSLLVSLFLAAVPSAFCAAPSINFFTPTSGSPGTTVTISGAEFGPTATNDIVYFGPVRATITAANATNITVTVPNGAMYAPITVTAQGLVAYSSKPFEPTFSGNGAAFDASSFAPRLDIPMPNGPTRIAVADLDGDGKPDLIIGSIYAHQITILQNISTSGSLDTNSFAAPVTFPFVNTAESPYWLLAGDVDGDGKIDLIAPDEAGNQVLIYRNISVGGLLTSNSFAAPVAFNVGMSPRNIALRDLDGDGRPDLASANIGDQTVSILKNIGAAGVIDTNTFAPQFVLPTGSQPHDLTFGDLDGDGKPDLAVNNYSSPFVSLFRNVSVTGVLDTNSFEGRVDLPAPLYCNSVVMGDMDADGKLDLLIGTAIGNNEVSVFRNVSTSGSLTTNSFAPHLDFPAAGWVDTVAVGDLNGDGKLDVLAVNQMNSTVSIFENVGTGSFSSNSLAPRVDYVSGSNPYSVSVVDLDGDGRPDVLFNNVYSDSLSIYRNLNGTSTGPFITAQPTNRTVAAGSTATFSVTAIGTAPLYYQWYGPASNLIVGAVHPTLILSNVQPSAAGNYFVLVTNLYGFAQSSNATLTVIGSTSSNTAPVITRQPSNQVASVGGNVTFSVRATGSPTLYYQWYFGDGMFLSSSTVPMLTLSNVQPSNAGNYFVVVSNLYGFARSSNATLTVTGGGGGSNNCTPPPTGIVGWWKGEGNATDSVGGNNGTLLNGVGFAPGEVGQGFLFTHTNQNVKILVSSNLDVGLGDGLTLEAWIKPSDVSQLNPILEYNADDGVTYWGVHMYVLPVGTSNSLGALYANVQDVNDNWHQLQSADAIVPANSLQHVALTYDKASGVARLYRNGTIVTEMNFGSFTPKTTGYLNIGCRPTDPANQSFTFAGVIDEPSVYRRALSSNEIAAIYNAGTSGKCSSVSGTAPVITHQPTNQTASIGGTATFSVTAIGTAPLYYQWYGPASNLISGAIHSILTLSNIQPSAAGSYFVLVTNVYGFAQSSNATLTVVGSTSSNTAPVITHQPTNQTVSAGGTATFSVTATGTAPLYYQWYGPASNLISGAVHSILTLSNIQPSAAGSYFVLVTNVYGFAQSSNATLTVVGSTSSNTAPVITHQPTNQTVSAGGTATFSVTATGTAPLYYQWYGPASNLISGAVNPTLVLSNVQPSAAGAYFVLVTNSYGFAQSSNAVLTVTGGGGGTNTCTPPPSGLVAWWKAEGNALDSAGTNHGTLLGGLGFTNGEVGQAFNFVNNSQGVQVNASASLAVSSITIEAWINPTDVSNQRPIVEYGEETGLETVQFDYGWNDPGGSTSGALYGLIRGTNGTWLKINSPGGILPTGQWSHVAMSFNFTNQTGTLYLNGTNVGSSVYANILTPQTASPVHIGYRPDTSAEGNAGIRHSGGLDEVAIYNRALNQSEIAAIFNAGANGKCPPTSGVSNTPPVIVTQPTNQTVSAGGTAAFSVTATGSPTLHYQWYGPASNLIAGAISRTLILSNAQPTNAGTYFAVVTNQFGFAQSSNATLTVTGTTSSNLAPTIVTQPTNQTVSVGGTAIFSVTATGSPAIAPHYRWYGPGSNIIVGAISPTLVLTNVQPTNAGTYFVVVSNAFGFAVSSNATLSITSAGPAVVNPQPTINLAIKAGSSQLTWPVWAGDFTLQATGDLTPPINWTNVPVTLETNGDLIEVTLPASDEQGFFRLYHP
jgi:hypothetical protein